MLEMGSMGFELTAVIGVHPHQAASTRDNPYLAPVPLRGKRCEPAFVVHTARCLAETRQRFEAVVAETTTTDAYRGFRSRLAEAVGV